MMSIVLIMFCGLLATSIMIAFMESIHHLHWARADMVEAIGTAITGDYSHSFRVGLFFDLFLGSVFALIYYGFLRVAPISTDASDIILLAVLGIAQGLAVGMLLVILVDASKTFQNFRTGNTGIILGYLSGHFIYGLALSLIFLAFHVMPLSLG